MRTAAIIVLTSALATTASGRIVFDLTGIDEYGTGLNEIGSFEGADPGAQVGSIELIDGMLETYNNTGIANFGDEAILAVELADADGNSVLYYFFPFPSGNYPGPFGPVTMSIDLSDSGYYIPDDGVVTAYAASIWDDGSGEASGTWLQGMLEVNLIPAPAGLALLFGAGAMGGRRRRRTK